jgi:hypothetical protein
MSDPSLAWYAPNSQCVGVDVVGNMATGADAGSPGTWTPTGSTPPWDVYDPALHSVVANPQTAWTTGQRMVLGNGSLCTWGGTDWVGGPAPLAEKATTKATKAAPEASTAAP